MLRSVVFYTSCHFVCSDAFSLVADWVSESASNQYFLGELINIEASVLQFYHVPLRVYVDGCVATPVPDLNAVPRYSFIDNYG